MFGNGLEYCFIILINLLIVMKLGIGIVVLFIYRLYKIILFYYRKFRYDLKFDFKKKLFYLYIKV